MSRFLLKRLLFQFSRFLPLQWMQGLTNQNFIFPFYHLVSDAPSPLVKHLYPVTTVSQFCKDLDFLQKHFSPATFSEVLQLAKNKVHTGGPRFFLTFDDGFSECYHVILPILRKKNLPAAFFINPAFIGNQRLSHRQKVSLLIEHAVKSESRNCFRQAEDILKLKFQHPQDFVQFVKKFTVYDTAAIEKIALAWGIDFNEALQLYKPYMNVLQLRELTREGYVVGSHGYDHPEFNLLSEEAMKDQVLRSFQFPETASEMKERIFSFPFHDIGIPLSFFRFLQDEAGVKASFGTSGIKNDVAPGHLQRIPIELNGFRGAEQIIRTEYFYYLVKSLIRKNLVNRK